MREIGEAARVRRAGPGDEQVVRALRLQALSDSPDAFESTLEREQAWANSDWQRWLASGATFILEQPDGPIGIVAGVPHRDEPTVVLLISMWIHPRHRGTGVGDALVASVLSWAQEEGAAEVWLHVGKTNDRARRFYEKNGFWATDEALVREKVEPDEIEMRFVLARE